MSKKLFIFGSGDHSKVVLNEVLKKYHFSQIFFVNQKQNKKKLVFDKNHYKILCSNEQLKKNIDSNSYYFIGVGSETLRKKIYIEIKSFKLKNFKPIKIISNNSNIDDTVKIGKGSLIMPGVTINCNSVVGSFTIINTNSSIDHDCVISNFVSIGPGVNIAGNVQVKDSSFVGIGSSVKENIVINKGTIIGGGSFVNRNCLKKSYYFGVPAKRYYKK